MCVCVCSFYCKDHFCCRRFSDGFNRLFAQFNTVACLIYWNDSSLFAFFAAECRVKWNSAIRIEIARCVCIKMLGSLRRGEEVLK